MDHEGCSLSNSSDDTMHFERKKPKRAPFGRKGVSRAELKHPALSKESESDSDSYDDMTLEEMKSRVNKHDASGMSLLCCCAGSEYYSTVPF